MTAPKPTFRTVVSPPELPAIPGLQTQLAQYLRTFSLWCRNGFADKLSGTVAQPGIMIQATDSVTGEVTNFVYMVGVSVNVPTSGTPTSESISFTLMPTGSGNP